MAESHVVCCPPQARGRVGIQVCREKPGGEPVLVARGQLPDQGACVAQGKKSPSTRMLQEKTVVDSSRFAHVHARLGHSPVLLRLAWTAAAMPALAASVVFEEGSLPGGSCDCFKSCGV
jgi:hypothetical protein